MSGDFHPSIFEDRNIKVSHTVSSSTLSSTTSSTPPSSTTKPNSSNTRHLFKNLYGETPLTYLYFSDKNIENLQKVIRYMVHKETGYVIDNQSQTELLIIMRSIFLEYSSHPPLLDNKMSEERRSEILLKYKNEVIRLNDIVINTVIPKIISQLQQYITYLEDASRPSYQMETPESSSIAGQRQYRSVTQVLIGGDL